MAALDLIATWPTPLAAVGVTSSVKTLATVGPIERLMPWASVTKILTALAVLVAVEEGTLSLQQPAGPPGSTVRHLLAHASGLGPDGGILARPGERRIYSNTGFEVLGDLVAKAASMPFGVYLDGAILEPLELTSVRLNGSPAYSAVGCLEDLLALGRELLAPTLLAPETWAEATSVAFPGLAGVLPGFGRQDPNDWGLGLELRDHKRPHWTGSHNSPRTFGHFGRSATFLWVDPEAGLACACLTELEFGRWAAEAWPRLSDAVLAELRK